jgi:hypothetical protein
MTRLHIHNTEVASKTASAAPRHALSYLILFSRPSRKRLQSIQYIPHVLLHSRRALCLKCTSSNVVGRLTLLMGVAMRERRLEKLNLR